MYIRKTKKPKTERRRKWRWLGKAGDELWDEDEFRYAKYDERVVCKKGEDAQMDVGMMNGQKMRWRDPFLLVSSFPFWCLEKTIQLTICLCHYPFTASSLICSPFHPAAHKDFLHHSEGKSSISSIRLLPKSYNTLLQCQQPNILSLSLMPAESLSLSKIIMATRTTMTMMMGRTTAYDM